jgi:hypothetical protein
MSEPRKVRVTIINFHAKSVNVWRDVCLAAFTPESYTYAQVTEAGMTRILDHIPQFCTCRVRSIRHYRRHRKPSEV